MRMRGRTAWSSSISVLLVALVPFLVRCGGDDAHSSSSTDDAGVDGSGDPNSHSQPTGDGGTKTGTDGGGNMTAADAGPEPGWANAPLKSPGCGKAGLKSGSQTVQVDGGPRTFLVEMPQDSMSKKPYDPNNNYPIVFGFHGIDAQGADLEGFLPFQDYSMGTAIAVFPDGEQISPGSYRWDTSGDKDLHFFDAMLTFLENNLCINERRVFVLGFSLGAYMVNHLGCKRSDVIRAFIPADGGFPDNPATCGKTTVLVYHRTEDDNEVIANGKKARDNWLKINGCGTTFSPTPLNTFGFNTGAPDGPNGCVQYDGCPGNTTVSWCEDMYISPQGYKHDLRQPYRIPMWNWFNHF
jgi:poly(3-hydroxybutyrate) depolymerase